MLDGLVIDLIGGNCPVQAEGTINGVPFYFRARGERWAMHIGGADLILQPAWRMEQAYGDEKFAAGWMDEDEAVGFIIEAAGLWFADTSADAITAGATVVGSAKPVLAALCGPMGRVIPSDSVSP